MGSPKQTAVNLSKNVQKIKDELAPVYGLKNILSAGLLLFSRLSDTEQKKAVAEVNKMVADGRQSDESPRQQLHNAINRIKEMLEIEHQQPGTIYRVLDKDEQKILDDFRKLMLPEGKKRSRTA